MKPETFDLYYKYRYFLRVLSNERLRLFLKNENDIDFDSFFDNYNHVIYMHYNLKPILKNCRRNRARAFQKFEYGKYEILLRSVFCPDIKNLILSFIIKI